jgi:Zn-dependent peptidase ImmA (M78 family)
VDDSRLGEDDGRAGFGIVEEAPGPARVAFCRKAAEQLLKRNGITQPPVPAERLAERLRIQVIVTDLPAGVDALLRIDGDSRMIELASGQARVRHRFSIAHELGHFSLGHRHGESDVAEQEANTFAGALLVPRAWLKRDIERFATVDELARRFDVSREVLFIALKDARLLDRLR